MHAPRGPTRNSVPPEQYDIHGSSRISFSTNYLRALLSEILREISPRKPMPSSAAGVDQAAITVRLGSMILRQQTKCRVQIHADRPTLGFFEPSMNYYVTLSDAPVQSNPGDSDKPIKKGPDCSGPKFSTATDVTLPASWVAV